MAVNPTYKQLESSLRIGAFTVGQWAQVLAATVLALLFGVYVSPLPPAPTIFVSIVLAGMPLALSYAAMAQEWSVADALTAQVRWLTNPRRHLAGAGEPTPGYLVTDPARDEADADPGQGAGRVRPSEDGGLWDL